MIIEYKMLHCCSSGELEERVNTGLSLGWKLYGNPNNTSIDNGTDYDEIWYQAMVKENDDD